MKIAILFGNSQIKGKINVVNGVLENLSENIAEGDAFHLPCGGRLDISLADFSIKKGAYPTIINVQTDENPFSFS